MPLTLYTQRGSRGISEISPRRFYQNDLAMWNTTDMVPSPLLMGEVLFFSSASYTTWDLLFHFYISNLPVSYCTPGAVLLSCDDKRGRSAGGCRNTRKTL
jgi:hypothetical protein